MVSSTTRPARRIVIFRGVPLFATDAASLILTMFATEAPGVREPLATLLMVKIWPSSPPQKDFFSSRSCLAVWGVMLHDATEAYRLGVSAFQTLAHSPFLWRDVPGLSSHTKEVRR